MAVWQYDVTLVPREGIIRHHGSIPDELPGYRAVWNPEESLDDEYPNYWVEREPPETWAAELVGVMARCESWSKEALMFGHEDGDRIELWLGERIKFRFDLRRPDLDLLRAAATFALSHDLLWVSDTSGRPIEPNFLTILQDIQASDAYRFCKDPEGYLKTLPREARVKKETGREQ